MKGFSFGGEELGAASGEEEDMVATARENWAGEAERRAQLMFSSMSIIFLDEKKGVGGGVWFW